MAENEIQREKSSKRVFHKSISCQSLHLYCKFAFWCATNGMIIHPWFIQCFRQIIKKAFYANLISLLFFSFAFSPPFYGVFPRFFQRDVQWRLMTFHFTLFLWFHDWFNFEGGFTMFASIAGNKNENCQL